MLKYLVILLDDTSISYCHYDVEDREKNLIPLNVLKEGVLFAMKNDLKIQYIQGRIFYSVQLMYFQKKFLY